MTTSTLLWRIELPRCEFPHATPREPMPHLTQRNRLILAIIALGAPISAAAAQDSLPQFERNTRLRLHAPSASPRPVSGRVVASTPEVVSIVTRRYDRVTLSRMQLTRIDIRTGRSAWRGAVKGTIVGSVAALIVTRPLIWGGQGPAEGSSTKQLAGTSRRC